MMERLASLAPDPSLAGRLRAVAREAIASVKPEAFHQSMVGHLRAPVAPLVFGHVPENLDAARRTARGLLARFDSTGAIVYHASPGAVDYGRTHSSREASGLAASVVQGALSAAAFSGDRGLVDEAIQALRSLDRFRDGVPRGAQTWEIALHTPDILGAARLIHAYALGYELTGDPTFLESARYWAWTGVPFVYLVNPTGQPIGPYATTAVLGATNWVAPVWMGRPVQWCGLVYADALLDLARHDPQGPWSRLAEGITASGAQQTYPPGHPHGGLLPDSFNLGSQSRNPADINPGTLQPLALRLLTGSPDHELRALRASGLWVLAPGALERVEDVPERAAFTVVGWGAQAHNVIIHGCGKAPRLKINGRETPVQSPHQFLSDPGTLVLQVEGTSRVELELR